PASLSHASRSALWVFSHWVIDWVSLSSILLFMHVQYLVMTSTGTLAFLLSLTHCAIHFASSGPDNAGTAKPIPASTTNNPIANFIDSVLQLFRETRRRTQLVQRLGGSTCAPRTRSTLGSSRGRPFFDFHDARTSKGLVPEWEPDDDCV